MPSNIEHIQEKYASLTETEKREVSRLVKSHTDAVSKSDSPVESMERVIRESIEIVLIERGSQSELKTLTGKDLLQSRAPYSEYRDYSCYYR